MADAASEAPVAAAPAKEPKEKKPKEKKQGDNSKEKKQGDGSKDNKPADKDKEKTAVDISDPSAVHFSIDKNADFAAWYEQICIIADIVDKRYPIKGMPVFKPYGFYMHNKIMDILEKEWEKLEIEKAQFPLLIPKNFLEKEEDHVKGFEAECFWVTKGGLNDLEMPLALRPTSETAMYYMFALWVRSFRDLPLKVHQTCDVFRYETKDTRPLIRVREIFWNEGHTCHASSQDALEFLEDVWKAYLLLINGHLGVYGLRIRRPDWDKFAGAEHTDVMDAVMPCGRVLQIIGAHYLGQKFAKVFDIKFLNQSNDFELGYMTCFGVSTRLLASTISIHGDNKGLVLPECIARFQIVIVPIVMGKKATAGESPIDKAKEWKQVLMKAGYRVTLDDSDKKPGEKYYYWEMKGVPLRMEIGPRDVAANQVTIVRRDTGAKITIAGDNVVTELRTHLDSMVADMKVKSEQFFNDHVKDVNSLDELRDVVRNNGGFARFPFHSMGADAKESDKIVHETCGGEVRGFRPEEQPPPDGTKCLISGLPAKYWAYAARSY
mmetsp:Transcript_13656/g.23400  ORF Transcript_13656/g.23400 Transcript_13656/m.23400 type:complete len:549 (+) Transcript_13656:75-1721(+)|eukprot:CAMPEP_0196658512 /NCGR_PEP_ID=MMETSP1086-20130531/30060_1 /TAXON_ID=77921 /ORGANISM="Cyanoptyche  gloeocystis , Strain SAG4.97" /LENGTH=548 /DNA_ID=CAMNT_0041992123 /DNA_START=75 /DNA_END=1721 /DNA_ORIENTATION=-